MACPFCGDYPFGRNRERCYWCREYYELTSDYGRNFIDEYKEPEPDVNSTTTWGNLLPRREYLKP